MSKNPYIGKEDIMFEALKLVIKDCGVLPELQVGRLRVGTDFLMIAGPCSIESEEQIWKIAETVKKFGANMLRGGAFKPRTSPYSFQGLGREGLKYICDAGKAYKMPVVSEIMDPRDLGIMEQYIDILQIGARNMQNFSLLKEVGKSSKAVLLKRGMCATLEEWLNSAEYILNEGNNKVILCERGLRTIENYTRNTLDISSIAALRRMTYLPVIVDPSHATGRKELMEPVSLGAVMAGCQGIMLEVHCEPELAKSDAQQALRPEEYESISQKIIQTVNFRNRLEEES